MGNDVNHWLWFFLNYCAESIISGSCYKYHNKHNFVATSILLSRQIRICRGKTRLLRDKSMLAASKPLSRQNYVCRDKRFVATKENTYFVATKICLSRENICRDKHVLLRQIFVATNIILSRQTRLSSQKKYACCDKTFVATKLCLSWQKWYLWQLPPMTGKMQGMECS